MQLMIVVHPELALLYQSGTPGTVPTVPNESTGTSPDSCVCDQGQGLFDEVVALAEFVDCVVYEVACDVVKAVGEVVELFGVVLVVIEHVLEEREGLFR